MTQDSNTFWDYTVALQSKNSLLHNTPSHLSDDQLQHQLSTGMETRLSKKISTEKVNKMVNFCKWFNEVKHYDDQLCDKREEHEHIAKESREVDHHNSTATEPNHHVSNVSPNYAASSTA